MSARCLAASGRFQPFWTRLLAATITHRTSCQLVSPRALIGLRVLTCCDRSVRKRPPAATMSADPATRADDLRNVGFLSCYVPHESLTTREGAPFPSRRGAVCLPDPIHPHLAVPLRREGTRACYSRASPTRTTFVSRIPRVAPFRPAQDRPVRGWCRLSCFALVDKTPQISLSAYMQFMDCLPHVFGECGRAQSVSAVRAAGPALQYAPFLLPRSTG